MVGIPHKCNPIFLHQVKGWQCETMQQITIFEATNIAFYGPRLLTVVTVYYLRCRKKIIFQ